MVKQTLEQYLRANHTQSTADNYLFEIKNFIAINPRARFYKYGDLVKYVEGLAVRYSKVPTRVRILAAVKKYYDFLLHTGRRNNHPCRKLNIKRNKTAIQTQDLFTIEELQLLYSRPNRYKYIDTRDKVIISLLIHQALTSNEITNLNLSNVDLDKGTIHIKASRKISGRTLELDKSQIMLFDTYINEVRPKMKRSDTNRLILSKLGKGISVCGIHSIFEPMKVLFPNKNLCPIRIRMSIISIWLNEKKIPVEQVMDMSGQKWPSSVMMYKKINVEEQRELINRYHPLK
ncbi:MAG: site-specific integrase [Bacteroidales bacterium]|nr:site-specific integrase [Bacteroidales bacterium]